MVHRNSEEKLFSKGNLIFFTAILIVSIIITAARSEVPSIKADAPSNNEKAPEQTGYTVQTNITTPQGAIYKRGESLPFVVEIRNGGKTPFPFQQINGMRSFKITDKSGRSIGEDRPLGNHIFSWEYADGNLLPGQTISDTFYLERMLLKPPEKLPSIINIQFALPIQAYGRGNNPIVKYSKPITIELKDSPFGNFLTSADLPEQWTDDLDITYEAGGGIVFRYSGIHIDGRGQLTTIGAGIRGVNDPIKKGLNESIMEPNKLDELIRQLREFKIEKLNEYDTDKTGPDMIYSSITIAKGGKVFCGRYGPNKSALDLARIIFNAISDGQYPPVLPPRRGPR